MHEVQVLVLVQACPGKKCGYSPVENQNDLELDFKVFFFVDSCCVGIVLDESN